MTRVRRFAPAVVLGPKNIGRIIGYSQVLQGESDMILHNEFEHAASDSLKEVRVEAARSLIIAGGSMPDLEYIPRGKSEIRK